MINNRFWKEQKRIEWINVRDNIKHNLFQYLFRFSKRVENRNIKNVKASSLPLILGFFHFSLSNFSRKKSSSILLIMIVLQLLIFFLSSLRNCRNVISSNFGHFSPTYLYHRSLRNVWNLISTNFGHIQYK